MINKVCLVGRLAKEIDLRKTNNNTSVSSFTLAVDGIRKDSNGKYVTEFINCIAWRGSGEYLAKYAHKGDVVAVAGSIQNRNYEGRNGKVYITEVVCEKVAICSTKKAETQSAPEVPESTEDNFSNTPSIDISSDDLPFY